MNIALITGSRAEAGLMEGLSKSLQDIGEVWTCNISYPGCNHIHEMKEALYATEDWVDNVKPDFAILPGDRYEMAAAGMALHMLNIPMVHIFGGYITEGSQDDGWRHCLTKLSSLHFVENEECRRRVIQMGEHPDTVFNVGMIGCDFSDIEADDKYDYLVIYHPETHGVTDVEPLKEAMKGKNCLWFLPNNDPGEELAEIHLKDARYENWKIRGNLPRKQFLSYLKGCKAIVGNSSAGIREAPMLGTPCVNIGDRQKGRFCHHSAYAVGNNEMEIRNGLLFALSRWKGKPINHDGTPKIVSILNDWKPTVRKRFYDLEVR